MSKAFEIKSCAFCRWCAFGKKEHVGKCYCTHNHQKHRVIDVTITEETPSWCPLPAFPEKRPSCLAHLADQTEWELIFSGHESPFVRNKITGEEAPHWDRDTWTLDLIILEALALAGIPYKNPC
jgi:hypothetical protein